MTKHYHNPSQKEQLKEPTTLHTVVAIAMVVVHIIVDHMEIVMDMESQHTTRVLIVNHDKLKKHHRDNPNRITRQKHKFHSNGPCRLVILM